MDSDKGGKPGQWSARKSQMLARDTKNAAGAYTGPKDEAAKSLEAWTEQDWQTQGGHDKARKDDKTSRYLPKRYGTSSARKRKRKPKRRR
jgi:hypothetical protein